MHKNNNYDTHQWQQPSATGEKIPQNSIATNKFDETITVALLQFCCLFNARQLFEVLRDEKTTCGINVMVVVVRRPILVSLILYPWNVFVMNTYNKRANRTKMFHFKFSF